MGERRLGHPHGDELDPELVVVAVAELLYQAGAAREHVASNARSARRLQRVARADDVGRQHVLPGVRAAHHGTQMDDAVNPCRRGESFQIFWSTDRHQT